jgi:putative transposase
MKKSKFTESQIVAILKQQEAGLSINNLCREHGISQATFFNWKKKFSGMDSGTLKRLK